MPEQIVNAFARVNRQVQTEQLLEPPLYRVPTTGRIGLDMRGALRINGGALDIRTDGVTVSVKAGSPKRLVVAAAKSDRRMLARMLSADRANADLIAALQATVVTLQGQVSTLQGQVATLLATVFP